MKKDSSKKDSVVRSEKANNDNLANQSKNAENETVIVLKKIALETKKTNELLIKQLQATQTQNELLVNLATSIEELVNLMNSSVEEAAQSFVNSATNEEEKIFSFEDINKTDKLN